MVDNGKAELIDIDEIMIDPMQSRMGHWKDDEQDNALVDSMKGIGQIQDVVVRPLYKPSATTGGEKYKYGLVAGSRRFHSSKICCIRFGPCPYWWVLLFL